jgi:transmembrane sensor
MPYPPDDLPWTELGRWFAGEFEPEAARELERWIKADPERQATVETLRRAWEAAARASRGWDASAAIRRVHEAAANEARVIGRVGPTVSDVAPVSRGRLGWSLGLAAAVLLATVSTVVLSRLTRSARSVEAITTTEYRTPPGQRLAVRLGDGTLVTLAPGSTLRRRSDYGQANRALELEGEAYFVVTHDSTRPFTVRAKGVVARDLGTRFDIKAHRDDPIAEVAVVEGKVDVSKDGPNPTTAPAILVAGQLARVDDRGALAVQRVANIERLIAWTDGRLVFAATPLAEVRRQLERWYDVEIRFTGATLGSLRVDGEFEDEPIAQVLDAIARSLDLTVRRSDRGYELSPN